MRAKIGYMAILVLMGFLYLWTNVAVTFYLFFGLLLFAILSFLLNGYAARHLTMHLQVKQDLNQVSTILICVKNTGIIPWLPGVNERNDCKLPDRFFLLF